MDADGAGREAELQALRVKNEELRTKLQEQSARAAQAWARISTIESDKREAERKQALLQANNELLTQDIESLQLQLSGSAGWLSSLTGSADQGARTSTDGAVHEAALAVLQEEIAGLQEELKESRRSLETCEHERGVQVAENSKAEAEIANLRDQLKEQAPKLREQAKVVQHAVERQIQSDTELITNMERVLLAKVAAAEEATAAETKRAQALEERLKDYEEVAVEKADDVMAWLETPLGGGPSTPERPGHRRRASSSACSEDGMSAAGDDALEELEMGEMTARLRMIFEYLHRGPGPDRPGRPALAEMAEACVEEAEALELCRERVEEKRTLMEEMRVSQLRRAPEHRDKSPEEVTAVSNRAYEEVLEFAKSAADSAVTEAGGGAAGYRVEATIWSLLADSADQRLMGNQYKQQLHFNMQAKMDQLDSEHRREAEIAAAAASAAAAEAATKTTPRNRSRSTSSSGSMSDPLRHSGRDSMGGLQTATALTSVGSGMRLSFKGSGLGAGIDAAGEGGGTAVRVATEPGERSNISDAMNGANAHVGYLWKRGAVNRSWKRRWCELKAPAQGSRAGSGLLLYYTDVSDATPRGVINLAECSYQQDWSASNRKHTFKLVGNHQDGTKTAYLLAAGTAEEKMQWLELMQR